MSSYNVIPYGIRIILNPVFYNKPSYDHPYDVEGTVLTMDTPGGLAVKLIKSGNFLELLCNPNINMAGIFFVRWDNDRKSWCSFGTAILRNSKMSRCNNIWKDEQVMTDTRNWYDLKPSTSKVQLFYTFNEVHNIKAPAKTFVVAPTGWDDTITSIPTANKSFDEEISGPIKHKVHITNRQELEYKGYRYRDPTHVKKPSRKYPSLRGVSKQPPSNYPEMGVLEDGLRTKRSPKNSAKSVYSSLYGTEAMCSTETISKIEQLSRTYVIGSSINKIEKSKKSNVTKADGDW